MIRLRRAYSALPLALPYLYPQNLTVCTLFNPPPQKNKH